jgi:CHAT domain-containing protein
MLGLVLVNSGCVEKKMSVKEAKAVTVSMEKSAFEAPPRRIGDILDVLDQPGVFDPAVTRRYRELADSPVPADGDKTTLAQFLFKRGDAASHVGRSRQARDDLRMALQYSVPEDRHYPRLLFNLGNLEAQFGNLDKAIALTEESLALKPRIRNYEKLVKYYSRKGDFKTVKKKLDEGIALADKMSRRANKRNSARHGLTAQVNGIKAQFYGSQGQNAAAEAYLRKRLDSLLEMVDRNPRVGINARLDLSGNLRHQGRLLEAEIEARKALIEALGLGGQGADYTARAVIVLGKVILKQNRFGEAEKLGRAGLHIMEQAGMPPDAFSTIKARQFLITCLGSQSAFAQAVAEYDRVRQHLEPDSYQHRLLVIKPELLLSLLKTGRVAEASRYIEKSYPVLRERFGETHRKTAIRLGLRGMASYYQGQLEPAYTDFAKAMPVISKKNFGKDKVVPRAIAESYLELLMTLHGEPLASRLGIEAADEAFMVADRLRGRSVQSAIAAASARVSGLDPDLADLARKEQDLSQRIEALQTILFDVLAMPAGDNYQATVQNLKTRIQTLTAARQALLAEIERRFPKYFKLRRPGATSIATIREILRPDEAMIAIYPGKRRTTVWAFTRRGPLKTNVVNLGRRELEPLVDNLRRALDPGPATMGDIPAFDQAAAYKLYRRLLAPVQPGWQGAGSLIVVAQGPLGRLPFSVLVTAKPRPEKWRGELFGNYRKIPWLIRTAAIARLPSAAVLTGLRAIPVQGTGRMTFAGFGDPYFSQKSVAAAGGSRQPAGLKVRGIRVTEKDDLDSNSANSVKLGDLSRLPDTADEIKGIAGSLGADLSADVFLGPQASESRVKAMDLTGKRVIAFATHALIPGDLDGLDQPALALTTPQITREKDDGLLTMEEVFRLKLNADWIVLSACNTGAAEGAGSEAASGLGRAFFFAGARAILVSMWPVETTSAAKLTTAIFRHQQTDGALSKAGAVRAAMLELIDSRGMVDAKTGKTVASYAHPLFWAPFVVLGDAS